MTVFNYNTTSEGDRYRTEFILNEKFVDGYNNALGFSSDEYVPNSIFANYNIWNSVLGKPVAGTIHLKQIMEYFKAPNIGDVFQVDVIIKEKYTKKQRDYLIFETLFYQNDFLYCKSLTTYLWGFAK